MDTCEIDWTAVAAWVQAFGSIAAIIAAIWIGKSSEKRARELVIEERRRQASIIASTLDTKLELTQGELEVAVKALQRYRELGTEHLIQITEPQYRRLVIAPHIAHLSSLRPYLLNFEKPFGELALDLIDSMEAHSEACQRFLDGVETYKELPETLEHLIDKIIDSMNNRISYIAKVRPSIQTMHSLGAP